MHHELVIQLPSGSYPIHIGPETIDTVVDVIGRLSPQQVVVVADADVLSLHGERIRACLTNLRHHVLTVPAGEASKSLQQAERLYCEMARLRVERRDLVVTFGGGMIGDLGGFVAATWMRGIPFIQVPTTLEAAIDASIGGKTAVNLDAGKNLVGAFHQPRAVIVDTRFFDTLPEREYHAGLAESVKHAILSNGPLRSMHEEQVSEVLSRTPTVLTTLISENCRVKAGVVMQDEREHGVRAWLNYGHTIGHAIETLLGYALRHGECVALGMLVENRISVERGLLEASVAERVAKMIADCRLPTKLTQPLSADDIIAATTQDKKRLGQRTRFALIRDIGDPCIVDDLADDEIRDALSAIAP